MTAILCIEQIEKLPVVTISDKEVLSAFTLVVEEEVEEGQEVFDHGI